MLARLPAIQNQRDDTGEGGTLTRHTALDVASIVICALVWGTSWYAITLQLGVVDPIVSLVYRFTLASALLFLWCALRGETMALSLPQHKAATGVGFFTFTIDYAFTYWAEARVVSAVVAVIFAALAFVNLVTFRLIFRERAPRVAWMAAVLGATGVALLSWSEIVQARLNGQALMGLTMAFVAVLASALGNVFARRGQEARAPLAASMAWSMGYGTLLLTLYAFTTGRAWAFDRSGTYVLSLLYTAAVASVVGFLLYFGLARRRGYTIAAYVLALTPLLAMLMSTLFEGKRWSATGLVGVALVLLGQCLLFRVRLPVPALQEATGPSAIVS
jgi:drug/metabolite transporter (DMT)-like permease